jgi:hypothetical protein
MHNYARKMAEAGGTPLQLLAARYRTVIRNTLPGVLRGIAGRRYGYKESGGTFAMPGVKEGRVLGFEDIVQFNISSLSNIGQDVEEEDFNFY